MKIKGNSFRQRLALGLIFALVLVYSVYHLTTLFGEEISTYAAGVTTETRVLHYNGYFFRDETVLTSHLGGVVDYHAEDGTKVAKGQALATVYENGDGNIREHIRRMDEAIAVLETSLGSVNSTTEMGAVKEEVGNAYASLVKLLAEKNAGGIAYQSDQLLIALNRMSALSEGANSPAYETLKQLKQEREELFQQGGVSSSYYAEKSGYFYAKTDGYESYFTADAVKELSGDSFYELIDREPESVAEDYGKICFGSEWFFVLPISLQEQRYFEVDEVCEGTFEKDQTVFPLTVEKIVEVPEKGSALVVFRCDRLPENFSFDRCLSVRLVVDAVSGIYVPKSVVERKNGARGVYVLRGSVVHFRYIDILYEGSDYYLVREGIEDDGDRVYLKVNDMIILNGKNMFEGRILD